MALIFVLEIGHVGRNDAKSEEKPKAEFPEEPKLVFKELARAGLNVGAEAEILINYVESPTWIDMPKHYHAGDEFVYMLEGSLVLTKG